MKKLFGILTATALSLSLVLNGYAAWVVVKVNELSFPGITLFQGNANDGALVLNSKIPGRTALDIWPYTGTLPDRDALAETVWYATRFQDYPTFERFNISQMAVGKQVRFGVERGGAGEFRDIIFCFEDVTPGVAACKLKVTLQGVYVQKAGQWVQIGE